MRDGIVTSADLELAIAERRPLASDPALARALSLICEERRPVNLGRAFKEFEAWWESRRVPSIAVAR